MNKTCATLLDQETKLVTQEEGIPDGWEGMDCGPESMKLFREQVSDLYTLKIYSFNIWFAADWLVE